MGDDGQVGRGNRLNGLITPGRAMSLEAVASVQLVAQIGRPVSAPLACFVEIIARDAITESLRGRVRDIARAVLEGSRPRG